MQRLVSIPIGESPLPRVISKNPRLLDGLRRARPAKRRRAVRRDRHERAALIVRLDDRGQQLRNGGAAGGDDRAGLRGFHGTPQREKSRAAFLKMPPDADESGGFRAGESFEQSRIPRPGADDELTDARLETAFYHIDRWIP